MASPTRADSPQQGKRRDAEQTRRRLLAAARELFAERGYDRTTLRDVGKRAGVDPTLVARYFDGKVGLYIAALRDRSEGATPAPLAKIERLIELLTLSSALSQGPIFPAAVQPHTDRRVQDIVRRELVARMVSPLQSEWTEQDVKEARLRAEIAAAAVIGIVLCRSAGTFSGLSTTSPEHLAELAQSLVAGLAGDVDE